MTDTATLLLALQHADGQFPGGGFAFSWGLEGLFADQRLTRSDLCAFIGGQLRHRWGGFDRPVLARAHELADDLDALGELDALVEAWSLAAPQRDGSRRAGAALLGLHARLGTAGASGYRERVTMGRACNHLPVVQGLVWRNVGLPGREALAVSAYSFAAGLATAAIRLGAASHLDAQRALAMLRPLVVALLDEPVPALTDLHAFAPLAEIAMLRQGRKSVRLFSN
jgi:urease accessory protein